jgi:hypothetical protein
LHELERNDYGEKFNKKELMLKRYFLIILKIRDDEEITF